MESISATIKNKPIQQPIVNQYVNHEFQLYGLSLAEKLQDKKHLAIYMKMAKTIDRSILDAAFSFVSDSQANNKGALFMWKVSKLKIHMKEDTEMWKHCQEHNKTCRFKRDLHL